MGKKRDDFDITLPQPGGSYATDAQGRILVQVQDLDSHTSFTATISNLHAGATAGAGVTALQQEGSSTFWSAPTPAGNVPTSLPTSNNKTVYVQSFIGGSGTQNHSQDFIAWSAGSGSHVLVTTAQRPRFFRTDQPVPIALLLQLDSPVSPGTCSACDLLNRPTLLRCAQIDADSYTWLSTPLDFCPGGALGFWLLQKSDPSTWELLLRQGGTEIVSYRLVSKAMDLSFPLKLQLGRASGECTNWPGTITIIPAP
jgi:hypothetical protein